MFRYKSYYKTLIMAVVIISLCILSMAGITYALFTNNVEDGTIGINATTGRISVDITDESGRSIVGEYLHFKNADNDGLLEFEPGKTYYTEGFQVKNDGTIPLLFRMYISNEPGMDIAKFSESFEFYVTTDPLDKNADVTLREFSGELSKDQTSQTYYLVIRMKASADNTYANQSYGGIGITVFATQRNTIDE